MQHRTPTEIGMSNIERRSHAEPPFSAGCPHEGQGSIRDSISSTVDGARYLGGAVQTDTPIIGVGEGEQHGTHQFESNSNRRLASYPYASGSGMPGLVTHHSTSFAQGRGQLAQASRNYELGFQAGRQDARRNLSSNYLRHRRQFNARWEPEFRDGYQNRIRRHIWTVLSL